MAFVKAELEWGGTEEVVVDFVGSNGLGARDKVALWLMFDEPAYFGWKKVIMESEGAEL